MNGYEAYKLYVALKNHFNSDTYDFFRYGGKTKASARSFEARPDKYFFNKLAKHKTPQDFVVANIIEESANVWVGDLVNEQQAEENYKRWVRRTQSLTYVFQNDLDALNQDDYNANFTVSNNQHPFLLHLLMQKKICIETLIILNDLCPFSRHWSRNIEEDIIWPSIHKKCKKYKPFLRYEKEKLKQIVVEKFSQMR